VILLDTHVLIWASMEANRLSKLAQAAIDRAKQKEELAIASITLWELANAIARGRIETFATVRAAVEEFIVGVEVKELTPEIVAIAAQFPETYPRDPADRLIGATARAFGMPLVTKDERIRSSRAVETIW
jgi:PIN domain nuclease of toxin-antitoxin system